MISQKSRLVYDGVCNLCAGAVQFLSVIDHKHTIEYAPYQKLGGQERRKYGLRVSELQGRMHIVRRDGSVVQGAAALAEACRLLAPITIICGLLNNPLAQRFYDFIAGRRYTFFGCRESCYLPGIDKVGR